MSDPNVEVIVEARPWYGRADILLLIFLAVVQVAQGVVEAAPSFGVAVPGALKLVLYGASLAAIAWKGLLAGLSPEVLTGVARLDRATHDAARELRERTGA